MSYDADIDLILADGEDAFTAGGVTVVTEFFEADAVLGGSQAEAGVVCGAGYVLVRASLFPSLATNQAVTLNGTAYRVVQKMRIQDGKILQVWLGDVNG